MKGFKQNKDYSGCWVDIKGAGLWDEQTVGGVFTVIWVRNDAACQAVEMVWRETSGSGFLGGSLTGSKVKTGESAIMTRLLA